MKADLKTNLSAKSTWIRLLYMLLFVVIFNVAELVAAVVILAQFLFKLFAGAVNEQLQVLGRKLGTYFRQIIEFLTYHTEDMPYPFSPWPNGGTQAGKPAPAKLAAEEPAAAKPARARKPKGKAAKKDNAKTKTEEEPKAEPEPEAEDEPDEQPESTEEKPES